METSGRAWIALGVSVAAYDILAPKGQTLSEGVDRGLEGSPLRRGLVLAGIGITACHLANLLPEKCDPFHYALMWKD